MSYARDWNLSVCVCWFYTSCYFVRPSWTNYNIVIKHPKYGVAIVALIVCQPIRYGAKNHLILNVSNASSFWIACLNCLGWFTAFPPPYSDSSCQRVAMHNTWATVPHKKTKCDWPFNIILTGGLKNMCWKKFSFCWHFLLMYLYLSQMWAKRTCIVLLSSHTPCLQLHYWEE